MKIEDGTGQSFFAKVDATQKLETRAVSEPQDKYLNERGYAWTVKSSTTAAGTNDIIFYIKNDGANPVILTTLRAFSSAATTLTLVPVTGTPTYAAGVALTPVNRNLGSSRTMSATIYEDTNTTGLTEIGDMFDLRLEAANTQRELVISSGVIIPQGQAMAMKTSAATLVTAVWSFAEVVV